MKPRRDITLGEMQDECKTRDSCRFINGVVSECKYKALCRDTMCKLEESCDGSEYDVIVDPCHWDLSDPPRFNEAQMAFWRGWYAMGAKFVRRWKVGHITFLNEYGDTIGTIERHLDLADVLEVGETLDLAELLGKDGAE